MAASDIALVALMVRHPTVRRAIQMLATRELKRPRSVRPMRPQARGLLTRVIVERRSLHTPRNN
jgi:hypothetical protein